MNSMDSVYLGTALLHAARSKARRSKVGAVLVTRQGVTLTGYNGTPAGWDNNCENEVPDPSHPDQMLLVTKPSVIHAELNCILKAAKEGVSTVGSTVYVVLSPCLPCAAMLAQAGIERLVYLEQYRMNDGVQELQKNGITVEQYTGDIAALSHLFQRT